MLKKIIYPIYKVYFFITSYFILFFTEVFAEQSETLKNGTLNNPLKVHSIQELLASILNIVVIIATPIVVFFIIYSGFLYVTAKGDASKVKEATQSLTYSVIGGILILGAFAIAQIVKNLVSAFI